MKHTSGKLLAQLVMLLAVLCFTCLHCTSCTKAKHSKHNGSVPAADPTADEYKKQSFSAQLIPGAQSIIYFDSTKPIEHAFTLTPPEPGDFLPYPVQKRPALVIAIDSSTALLFINRVGFVQLSLQQNKTASASLYLDTSIAVEGIPITTYTVGTTWQTNEHRYVLLYKDHILDSDWMQTVVYEFYGDTISAVELPSLPGNTGYAPYWVFPTDKNIWLMQYRYVKGDRSYTAFAQWDRTANKISELSRSSFEKMLIPVGIDKTPVPIQTIVRIINTPVLIEYRKADGGIMYINNGHIDDAILGVAATNDFGTYVLLEDGSYWLFQKTSESQQLSAAISQPVQGQFSVPLEDIHFKSALLSDKLFIASWEENGIPDTGRSGIAVLLITER